ncbi:hypothetical protein [Streptomyces sp. SID3343]|uniref:hypothetical protein n=1 Tax=Streptomyces sp. SID3343 TaxID=2690260 RepID=UPI0013699EE1|nr:hypothetical protein [Streptomyces sp. SID3343]MYV99725.1 hypothetical protein [Streptomyces sp. SID3343]
MTGVAQPTPEQVRAAADVLKSAIDDHLAAVEARQGESDPAVFAAYDALAAAAEAYDELLYDAHDEVTPFEVPSSGNEETEYEGPTNPQAVTVLIRRDYVVKDLATLVDHARRADDEAGESEPPASPHDAGTETAAGAVAVLFDVYDPDEIAQRADELGLEPGDSTLWVSATEPSEPGEWLDAPFDDADPRSIIYRFETSTAYEDDLEVLERDLH